ncbi:MAG: RecT family recombinase [Candidatus Aenigmatarchaeota archaeon]
MNITKKENGVRLVKILNPHLAGVPDEEILKGLALANYLGLDPVKRQVHFVPFGNSVQLIVSYLEYVKRAERSGKLNGWQIQIVEQPEVKAKVTIWRKDWEKPFEWEVYLKEAQRNTPTWREMPLFMLRKVAIAQAFRIAFPEETGELPYEEAEMEGVITPQQVVIQPQQHQQPQETTEPQAFPETPKWDLNRIKETATEELKQVVKEYRVTSKELIALFEKFNGDQIAIINYIRENKENKKEEVENGIPKLFKN